jgi:hypothetical protein
MPKPLSTDVFSWSTAGRSGTLIDSYRGIARMLPNLGAGFSAYSPEPFLMLLTQRISATRDRIAASTTPERRHW